MQPVQQELPLDPGSHWKLNSICDSRCLAAHPTSEKYLAKVPKVMQRRIPNANSQSQIPNLIYKPKASKRKTTQKDLHSKL